MSKFLSLIAYFLLTQLSSQAQAVSSYTTCPDVNIAVARAENNNAVNVPYYLYNADQSTGVFTLVPGSGYKDPANTSLYLQVNGVGVNKKDGFIYGLTYDGTVSTSRFVRLDKNYGVTSFGNIPSPSSTTGKVGIINSAAGEVDTAGNYYFTAATVDPLTPPLPTLDKFFLGKIANIGSLTTGPATVVYYEIDISNADCSNYISTFSSDPANSGLRDFSYSARTNTFFSYVTYKPLGAADFSGEVVELKPIAGSIPLKYQLVCNAVVNHHNAEVAGTVIDKLGKFTVLFTDGSFGFVNQDALGNYNGQYTQITATTGLPNTLRGDMASCGLATGRGPAVNPFTTCPNVNIAVARANLNANVQDPYYIYAVNSATGAVTQYPGGPLISPTDPAVNLQINGIGVNPVDGFMYGLTYEGTVNTARFTKFDYTYGVTLYGNVPPPVSTTGLLGFVNSAAGDIDKNNNYYFTAVTANPANTAAGVVIDKLFLGKIANISSVSGTPTPSYYEVDYSDVNCTAFISALAADPNNSGIKDITFNPVTNTFFVYATYKIAGATNFSGQLFELRPVAGSSPLRYKVFCNTIVNSNSGETAGSYIDNAGNFLVLLTDGTMGKMHGAGIDFQYSGKYDTLNVATGFPNPIRADMGSCGGNPSGGPTPVLLSSFKGYAKDCKTSFVWTSQTEINFSRYELEESFGDNNFKTIGSIKAKNTISGSTYSFTIPSSGKLAFYRLKMIDIDGKVNYSSVVSINNSCSKSVSGFIITPNPAADIIILNWYGIASSTTADIKIYNAIGALVLNTAKSLPSGSSVTAINVGSYSSGVYIIKAIDTRTNETMEQRFVKK